MARRRRRVDCATLDVHAALLWGVGAASARSLAYHSLAQGRLHQVEYAMEAVKQGSACVGAKSATHAVSMRACFMGFVASLHDGVAQVIVGLMRTTSEMSSYQPKVFKVDEHMGIAIAGLTADARYLTRYMRTECLNHRYVFSGPMQVGMRCAREVVLTIAQTQRLVQQIADKSQHHTQRYGRRPYGVGLLVIGYDQTGPHLFETDPSGNFYDYYAQAIGARSQSAKTYLERNYSTFPGASKEALIKHAVEALRQTIGNGKDEEKLSVANCAVAVVGKDDAFTILTPEQVAPYLA